MPETPLPGTIGEMKEQILQLFREHGELTAYAAGALLNISTHRSSTGRKLFVRAFQELRDSKKLQQARKASEAYAVLGQSRRTNWVYRLEE